MRAPQKSSSTNKKKAVYSPTFLAVAIDKNGRILRVNNGWTTQLGWEADALVGAPFVAFVGQQNQNSASRMLTNVIKEMQDSFTLNLKHKSKEDIAYSCHATMMTGLGDHEIYIRAQRHLNDDELDVEVKQYGDARNRHHDIVSRRLRMHAVAQLARRICHDINNIMTIISGNIQLLGMRDNDEKSKKYISNIEIATERAASVTQNLLKIVRNDQQHQQPLHIDEEIRDILTIIANAFPPSIVCKQRLQSDQRVMIDKAIFSHAIINIIMNAISAINDKGEVCVVTRNEDRFLEQCGLIIFKPTDAQLYAVVHIKDDGIGIAEDDITQLFNPQSENAVSTQDLRLGLSLLSDFCSSNGLGLQVQSNKGMGTSVFMWIPVLSTN